MSLEEEWDELGRVAEGRRGVAVLGDLCPCLGRGKGLHRGIIQLKLRSQPHLAPSQGLADTGRAEVSQ